MADLTPRTRSESFLNGEDLEPITRREHFYAGRENELPEGHQEPETREEWFIQKYREAGDVTVESLSITENGIYTAPSGKAYSPVSVNVPLPSNAYLLKSIEHEQVATFADGTDNFVKSLEVAVEPQQDLHGYDSPWVGGAGKNKYIGSPSFDGFTNINGWAKQTDTLNGHEVYKRTGTWNGCYKLVNLPTGTYTFSAQVKTSDGGAVGLFLTNDTATAVVTPTGNSVNSSTTWQKLSLTFNVTTAGTVAARVEKTSAGDIYISEFQLESGSTATSFAPYSNICPISGWDEVNVTVADDLENPTVSNVYTIDLDGTRYGGKLDVVNGVLTLTHGFISSYNGETLPSTWISDRDVYAEGTTPTIGAEVCYKLATPQTIQLTPTIIKSLQGANNFFADSGEIELLQYWGEVS